MVATSRSLDFVLPPELAAREPPEARGLARDGVRLLVTSHGGAGVEHARFRELPRFLKAGDLLVANDSATLPAALSAWRSDGSAVKLHLSTNLHDLLWVVEPRGVEVAGCEVLRLPGGGRVMLLAPYEGSRRLWVAGLDLPRPVFEYLQRFGKPIAYDYTRGEWPLSMYQTVYARHPGSAEMPSAGRAFTPDVLARVAEAGARFETLTLHTGVSSLEGDESPYRERFAVPEATAAAVREARSRGGRVIAVGTTVVRALESALDDRGEVGAREGWTGLVITPERAVRSVDALLTGFHEATSSHLSMLEALAGRRHVERAYRAALDGGYLWHEFGDLHLILP